VSICTKRQLLGACLVLSVALIPIAHLLGWVHSVVFVNDLSLLAIVLSLGAWWDAEGAKVVAEEGQE
jgi:hypothetical protein